MVLWASNPILWYMNVSSDQLAIHLNLVIYLFIWVVLQGCPFKSHYIYQNVMFHTCCGPNTWEALSVEIKNIKFSTNDFIWFIFLFRLTSLDVESKSRLIKMSKEEQMRLKY